MRIAARKYTITAATSGTLDTVTAGNGAAGASVQTSKINVGTLSAVYVVDAETNTITLAAQWQGSDDASTWIDIAGTTNNAANVVLATGTAGADATVTKAIPAPAGAYSFRYVRARVIVGITTGTTNDTYAISYRYLSH